MSKAMFMSAMSLLLLSCAPDGEVASTTATDYIRETSALAPSFEEAAAEFDVPADLLKALAFHTTGFTDAGGTVEFDDQPPAWGFFGLQVDAMDRAASLSGRSVDEMKQDPAAQIAAAAALLDAEARKLGLDSDARSEMESWRPIVASFFEMDDELRSSHLYDFFTTLQYGRRIEVDDGFLVIEQHGVEAGFGSTSSSLVSAGGTVFLPSPNYSNRGTNVELVVIHTCEGGYSGCVSYLRSSNARASAHYVVKEDGSQIAQLVGEEFKAWHIAANYRPHLNGGQLGHRSGQGTNSFSVGIEHGGFASQRSWPQGQIAASINLVRDITARHGIPRDRYHIVGHGQLQPENRSDPGANWPWAGYLAAIQGGGASSGSPHLMVVKRNGANSTEVHVLGAPGFGTFELHTGTALHKTTAPSTFDFGFGDFDGDGRSDLYAIQRHGGSDTTEVHVLSGASNFSTFLIHAASALHPTNSGNWSFVVGDYDADGRSDVYAINRHGGSNQTEVHVLSAASGFKSFIAHSASALHPTLGDGWEFAAGDWDADGRSDVYAINRHGGSNQTEVHILDARNGFLTFSLHAASGLHPTETGFDFAVADLDGDRRGDLYAVKRSGANGNTELHVLSAASSFASFSRHAVTGLHGTSGDDNFVFDAF